MTKSSRLTSSPSKIEKGLLYTTSEGRARFPDILQSSYGDKAVVGFGRYGRALGALVPMEAVRLLAGFDDSVDEDVRKRIVRTAKSLIQRVPAEAEICGLEADQEPELEEVEEIERERERTRVARPHRSRTKAATS